MSNTATSVNVKIAYKGQKKRQNEIKSLNHLHQVIEQLFNLVQKEYELTYIDNENDEITLDSQKCFEAAVYSAYNEMYNKCDQIKQDCDTTDIRRKLVLLKIKITAAPERKYDPDDVTSQLDFKWDPKMKGKNIDLSEDDMKCEQREGSFHAVRGTKCIPKGKISQWHLDIYLSSYSGHFFGLMSSEVDLNTLMVPWHDSFNAKEQIYGADDNSAYVYIGTKRGTPKWKRKAIPNSHKDGVRLRLTADYTKDCCTLCIEMLVSPNNEYEWVYQFLLPPNKQWFPAVQFEDPKSWARIVDKI